MKTFVFIFSILVTKGILASIYTQDTWKKNEIKVCFGNSETPDSFTKDYSIKSLFWSEKEKNLIRSWVEKDFSKERTGIFFSGWNECNNITDFDLVLLKSDVSNIKYFFVGGIAGAVRKIGNGDQIVSNYEPATNAIFLADATIDRWTVIHEFGHIAGLAHEHDHPKANCKLVKKKIQYDSPFVVEAYDPDSVMNYCSRKIKEKEDRKKAQSLYFLSTIEAELLKKLYP